ncbi:MAG: hypothetical protein Fur0036_12470 [Fimbriimonadaceae bacterium]
MSETPMPPVVIDPGPQPRLERRGQNGLGTLLESGRIAMDMLRMHKMRSFLTMLGVIIGVMAVSMIVLLQNGLKAYIESEFSELSADTIFIIYDPSRLGRGEGRGRFTAIKEEDREYILANADKVLNVTGVVMVGGQQARFGDKEVSGVQVTGVSQDYYGAVSRDLVAGRLIDKNDVDNLANVGIISSQLAEELMPGTDPLGKTVVFSGISVTIVGVVKEKNQNLGPSNTKTMEMPVTTVQRKWQGGRSYSYLLARSKPDVKVSEAMDQIWELLMRRADNKPVYRVDSSEALLGVFQSIIGGVGMVLASVAALSLLVGGIGIMNIMLVSVTERTKEIGLRMALGARRKVILTQFIIEAAFLSLVGGLIGMSIAWGFGLIITIITKAMKVPSEAGLAAPFPVGAAFIAAGFSAAIGMVFGFFPAMNAAKLDPIVALRKD